MSDPGRGDLPEGGIAVVGMAGRFPGARDLEEFWRNLRDGVESVRRFGDDELLAAGVAPEVLADPAYVKAGAVLDGIELFDAPFFGYSPREAALMDPQQRLLLESAWQALEDAGHDAERFAGAIGVFVGSTLSSYLFHLAARRGALGAGADGEAFMGNAPDFLATRIAYKLDLKGPAYSVHTACSTSLVAVHLACQALADFQVDLALAGGVSVRVPHLAGYRYQESGITSPDGRTRPFAAGAQGTLFGNGVGVVVLRRLEEALADGDRVLAVVRGSAANNDGALKVGFTAPNPAAQSAVVAEALAAAGVEPETVGYVEAHGTGTELGDPIEVAALTEAFRRHTAKTGFCALGSVKSNIGHLDAAAGISGFIKTVLALDRGEIPPSLHFDRPNPKIDFAASPFAVVTERREWPRDGVPRRAGVSSFGFGGTNVHVVVEEAPAAAASAEEPEAAGDRAAREWQLLTLSAKTATALDAAAARLADHLEARPGLAPAGVAHTLQVGRRTFPHRRTVVCRDLAGAVAALRGKGRAERTASAVCERAGTPVVFLFPGQGAQHPGMGRGLYREEPVFRAEIDRAADGLLSHLEFDLRDLLLGGDAGDAATDEGAAVRLRDTALAQPALFAVEHALARLWMSWGVRPAAMLGHSVGELVAAHLAGVFAFDDALALVAERGRLMAAQPAGAMLAVDLGEEEVAARLREAPAEVADAVELAAVNAPDACVVAGPEAAVAKFAVELAAAEVGHRRLHTSHAFHTAAMEPAATAFRRRVAEVELRPPGIPFVAGPDGGWIAAGQATDADYWARQLRRPVRFADGVATVLAGRRPALVEVGPGATLGALVRRQAGAAPAVVASLAPPRRPAPDGAVMAAGLGRLWLDGVAVDWAGYRGGRRARRVALPTYPFERRRYWVDSGGIDAGTVERDGIDAAGVAGGRTSTGSGHAGVGADDLVGSGSGGAVPDRVTVAAASENRDGKPGESPVAHREFPATAARLDPATIDAEVAAVLAQALGVARLGADDDFFALGGDSLIATRVLSRLRDRFGVRVPLAALFAAPTAAGLAARVAAARAEIASAAPDSAALADAPPLVAFPDDGGEAPLSFAQQRLWFLDQLDPGNPVYNLPGCLRLEGDLDLAALRRALAAVVERHRALRTSLPAVDGRAVQRAAAGRRLALPVVDLAGLPPARRTVTGAGLRLLAVEARRPFDLAAGPLHRALVVRLAADDHLVAITLHHVVSDGWSWGVLRRELAALYAAFATAAPSSPRADVLPPLPIQYTDFARWQRRWMTGETLAAEVAFWRARLTPLPPALALPADRPRPAVQSYCGATLRFRLPAELAAAAGELGRRRGATPFMTLFAAFAALLARYAGLPDKADVAVGTPVANRRRTEVEGLIGFFVNTLVLRLDLAGDPAFGTIVERAREVTLAAYAHQDLPFERLVDELKPERDLGTSPLFQVLFGLQNTPRDGGDLLPGLRATPIEPEVGTAKFDLDLELTERDGALAGALEFATDLFDRTTALRLIAHYRSLLAGAVGDPGRRLSELPLLAPAERLQVVAEWNDTAVAPHPAGLAERIAARAREAPDAVAVVAGEAHLSRGELERRAARLAARLRRMGVGAEVGVGLCVERRLEMVVALLAVARSGGWYLPLDPGLPAERLRFLAADSGVALILAGAGLGAVAATASAASGAPVAAIGDAAAPTETLESASESSPAPRHPLAALYTLYTSGSTGRPKGVQVGEGALLNFLDSMGRTPGLGPDDALVAVTTLSFDIAGLELWLPLIVGARLVVASRDEAGDGDRLRDLLARSGATAMQATPVTWRMLLAAGWDVRSPLRVLCGGEALPRELADRLAAAGGGAWNLYGPTETTVWSAVAPVTRGRGAVSLGRPLANTQAVVVDRRFRPVPAGVAGELTLGGAGVARGYLGRPALTAERFRPDPFAPLRGEPGARIYRTGDLVRRRADGELEFLGRGDHQVKVRGFRIELAEIESVLARHPAVDRTAVVARRDDGAGAGDPRLVAYVVPRGGGRPEGAELRRHLAAELPDYMLPAAFVVAAELPTTANGKLDRGALAGPAWAPDGDAAGGRGFVAPRDPVEETLAEIWAGALGRDRVGIHDNFFALGGDSILSVQIVSRARARGLAVSPRALFQHQTIAELAASAAATPGGAGVPPEAGEAAAALAPFALLAAGERERLFAAPGAAAESEVEDAYPLTPVQEGMLFHSLLAEGGAEPGVYVEQLSCILRGPLDDAAFDAAWRRAIARHPVLRTRFVRDGLDRPLQVVVRAAELAPRREDWRRLAAGERERRWAALLTAERGRPFDLGTAPLVRVTLVRSGDEERLFAWTFHHLVLDGWSAGVVLREVFAAYEGEPAPPPPRPFRDHVAWLAGRDGAAAEAFWREALAGRGETAGSGLAGLDGLDGEPRGDAERAPRGPRSPRSNTERGSAELELSSAATAALTAAGRARGLTLNTLLQGAWALLLGRAAAGEAEPEVTFGATVAGRPEELAGVEAMVGLFINTLPVAVRIDPRAAAADWLAALQERFADLRRCEHTPLARLRALAGVAPGEPLFETLLVVENYPLDRALARRASGLVASEVRFVERADVALALVAVPGERLLLRAGFDPGRLGAAAVRRLLRDLASLLAGLAAGLDRPVGDLGGLSAAERHQALIEWNDPGPAYPAGGCLHQLVEASADRVPDAVAVVGPGSWLTYGELEARANRLARRLRRLGVGPEVPVGLCLPRSPELIVGLLGILKAGGAYVPLDPELPAERIGQILAVTCVQTAVTASGPAAGLAGDGRRLVLLDRDEAGPAAESPERLPADPRRDPGPGHLAYAMFTSGSTGVPKGVSIPHRGVVNRLAYAPPAGHVRPGEGFLHKASVGFDVSLLEIFLPLAAGGRVVLAAPGGHQDPAHLAALLADEGVEHAIFTPSLLRLVLAEEATARSRAVRTVASSAEALPADLLDRFSETLPGAVLYNRYGPTEASIAASSWRCRPGDAAGRRVPIGRPIARARLYVVDRRLRPVAAGVAGELLIGGPGLARGYFGAPAQTAERFVPDPFAPFAPCGPPAGAGGRLYRTGDLARRRDDGAVEFLGRIDHQVKVRGFRVEPGEIEAVLAALPGVREAAVVARREPGGETRLHAYAVAATGGEPDVAGLRRALAARLPDYMLPASITPLAALPRNASGKVDRRALPAPSRDREGAGAGYAPPRTPEEAALAAIWAEVLGLERVGVDDDFFALGGDSILSIRVVSRAAQAGLRFTLRDVFERRTVARLAPLADGRPAARAEQGPVVGTAPLTPIQVRFFAQELPDPHHVNQAVMLAPTVAIAGDALAAAVGRLLVHHDALRLRFERRSEPGADGAWSQHFPPPGGRPPSGVVDLGGLPRRAWRRSLDAAAAAVQAGLDLAAGPLLRAVLFTGVPGGEDRRAGTRLLLVVHHLAVDGVSWRVLVEDLETALRQRAAGGAVELPAKTTSFRRWAERLAEHAGSGEVERELPYWLEDGRGRGPAPLPVDLPGGRAGNTFAAARTLTVALDEGETEALLRELPEVFRSEVDDALLTALLLTFTRWTGGRALLVDLEGHGRDHPFPDLDVSRTVGWFTAVYPLRLELGRAVAPGDALRAVRETRRRVPGGGLGYGLLRHGAGVGTGANGSGGERSAARRRDLARRPAAEVSFNYLGRLDRAAAASTLFRPADEPVGPTRGGRGLRRYLFEIDGAVAAGRLGLRWTWGSRLHRRETVERLAEGHLAALRELIAEARRPAAAAVYTPSDFPTVDLDQEGLDAVLRQVGVLGGGGGAE